MIELVKSLVKPNYIHTNNGNSLSSVENIIPCFI